ncbi:MAG: hypothetical protein D6808_07715, partial [Candidatus Dadabacteria bacterium]
MGDINHSQTPRKPPEQQRDLFDFISPQRGALSPNSFDPLRRSQLIAERHLSPAAAAVIASRDISDSELEALRSPKLLDLPHPKSVENLLEAAHAIASLLLRGNRIALQHGSTLESVVSCGVIARFFKGIGATSSIDPLAPVPERGVHGLIRCGCDASGAAITVITSGPGNCGRFEISPLKGEPSFTSRSFPLPVLSLYLVAALRRNIGQERYNWCRLIDTAIVGFPRERLQEKTDSLNSLVRAGLRELQRGEKPYFKPLFDLLGIHGAPNRGELYSVVVPALKACCSTQEGRSLLAEALSATDIRDAQYLYEAIFRGNTMPTAADVIASLRPAPSIDCELPLQDINFGIYAELKHIREVRLDYDPVILIRDLRLRRLDEENLVAVFTDGDQCITCDLSYLAASGQNFRLKEGNSYDIAGTLFVAADPQKELHLYISQIECTKDIPSNITVESSASPAQPQNEYLYINTESEIEKACHRLSKCKVLALDTETTVDDRNDLCLIQITADGINYIFDPIASVRGDNITYRDLSPLRTLLEENGRTVFIHNAYFDRRVLGRLGFHIEGVVD